MIVEMVLSLHDMIKYVSYNDDNIPKHIQIVTQNIPIKVKEDNLLQKAVMLIHISSSR